MAALQHPVGGAAPEPAGEAVGDVDVGLGDDGAGFELRGEAVTIAEHPDAVPITLLDGAVLRHGLEPGAIVTGTDVDVPDTLAHQLWMRTAARVLKGSHAA